MNKEDDVPLKEHEYDGIREYDNPLPSWWLATFFLTIIFSFLYWVHYELSGGQTQWEELKEDMAAIERHKSHAPAPTESEEELLALLSSNEALAAGKAVYDSKCAACHGPQLQGMIGPNLIDDYWLHGHGKLIEIAGVIRKGVLDKGMPPWEGALKDDEIKAVTAFIHKQKGTQPENPKPPQGEKFVSK